MLDSPSADCHTPLLLIAGTLRQPLGKIRRSVGRKEVVFRLQLPFVEVVKEEILGQGGGWSCLRCFRFATLASCGLLSAPCSAVVVWRSHSRGLQRVDLSCGKFEICPDCGLGVPRTVAGGPSSLFVCGPDSFQGGPGPVHGRQESMDSSMTSTVSRNWTSYLADNLLDSVDSGEVNLCPPQIEESNCFFWCSQGNNKCGSGLECQNDCISVDYDCSVGADSDEICDKFCARKRCREPDNCIDAAGVKACREKMRRDRLNDRFMELSKVLEPNRPPKTDKSAILSDTVRLVCQLRSEVKEMQASNVQLRESLKDLKEEKNELRDEKVRLKVHKEQLELHVRALGVLPVGAPFSLGHGLSANMVHTATAAVAALAAQTLTSSKVMVPQGGGYNPNLMSSPQYWMPSISSACEKSASALDKTGCRSGC